MSIIFRKNASNKEKAFTIFSYLWMGLAFYGVSINFNTNLAFNKLVIISSILWGIAMVYPVFNNKTMFITKSPIDQIPIYFFLVFCSCLICWCILALSFPAIYTKNFGKSISEEVQVINKFNDFRKFRCKTRIETSKFSYYDYCVPSSFFNQIKEKDFIIMHGKVSKSGYRATGFELQIN